MISAQDRQKVLRNATINLAGGAVALLVSLLVPMILSRRFSTGELLIWNLSFQTFFFVQVVSSGIPGVISRYAATYATESKRVSQLKLLAAKELVKVGMTVSAVTATACSIYIYLHTPGEFRSQSLLLQAIFSIGALAFAASSLYGGYLLGTQRNDRWVFTQTLTRISSILAILSTSFFSLSLTLVATAYSLCVSANAPISRLFFRKSIKIQHGEATTQPSRANPYRRAMLGRYLVFLTLNTSQILVITSAPFWVNTFANADAFAFSQNVYLFNAITAILLAVIQPLIPLFAQLRNRKNGRSTAINLLHRTQVRIAAFYVAVCILFFTFGSQLIELWSNGQQSKAIERIFLPTLLISLIRAFCLPMSAYFLSLKGYREAILPSAAEVFVFISIEVFFAKQHGLAASLYAMTLASLAGMAMYHWLLSASAHPAHRTQLLKDAAVQYGAIGILFLLIKFQPQCCS